MIDAPTIRIPTEGYPAPPPRPTYRKRKQRFSIGPGLVESLLMFLLFWLAFALIGWRVTVDQHVVPYDGMARLAHAYFVWWNSPPKLAAVGFVWPPIATFVYLPAALIKPLATSLLALPLTTAFFAAALLVLHNRLFRYVGMPRLLRYAILLAFAANPMFVFYAINGMGEMVYLFFLAAAVFFFFKWFLVRQPRFLILTSLCFCIGVLSRWELLAWAALMVVVIVVALIRQRVARDELEGMVIAYVAPIAYGLGLWLFANWLILGSPFYFFGKQAPGFATTPLTPAPAAARATAAVGGLPATPEAVTLEPVSLGHVLSTLIDLNARLFPLTIVVLVLLAIATVVRRDLMSLTLGIFVALNAILTGVLVYTTYNEGLFQLRYNMRALPLSLIAVAWLWLTFKQRWVRAGLGVATVGILLMSLPATWNLMESWRYQFEEQAFARAIATGKDQEGRPTPSTGDVGIAPERRMADYIKSHIRRKNAILTDDAQSFPVMLFTGRPSIFRDRIDQGDAKFLDVRDSPWGKVQYVLVSRLAFDDLVGVRYPRLRTSNEPGFRTVYKTKRWLLASVAPRSPARGPLTRG